MEQKEIRFIDTNYKELFRIPDGGSIVIKTGDGYTKTFPCKYIDDYHTEIDGGCFHIYEWAEFMEQCGFEYYPSEHEERVNENAKSLEIFKNLKFIEENRDEIYKDKFFKTDYGFEEVYYNPDSTAGGQLVRNEIDFDLIREAAKGDSVEKFYDYINSGCKQYSVDIDEPEFMDAVKSFVERAPDHIGDGKETANAMINAANDEHKQNKTEPER